jgi:DNA-binding NarL/FixJ family response regulator
MTNEAAHEAANNDSRKHVLICDTQPVAVEGMKWLIENSGDLRFAGSLPTLEAVNRLLFPEEAITEAGSDAAAVEAAATGESVTSNSSCDAVAPDEAVLAVVVEAATESGSDAAAAVAAVPERIDAIVIDKGLGFAGVMDLLQKLTGSSDPTPVVVWGAAVSEAEALRLLQAGARGILRRTSESGTLLTCLRAVTSGGTWMEDGIFGSTEKLFNPKRSQLTNRESQVVVLVEKGLRNRDIARLLGIQTGTVKIHLKHIFEKTGVRGRYGLAFTGLQNKGSITMTPPENITA